MVKVNDNGEGINEENIRLFKDFRVDVSRSKSRWFWAWISNS